MFAFCGELSSYTVNDVQTFLDNMNQLETEFPCMRSIYMTGHLASENSEYAYDCETRKALYRNNQIIRDY